MDRPLYFELSSLALATAFVERLAALLGPGDKVADEPAA
jgi:hypothetical protein